MPTYYLSINPNGLLEVRELGQANPTVRVAANKEELKAIIEPWPSDAIVTCSSSLDFPREYTDNPEVIALCDELRRS